MGNTLSMSHPGYFHVEATSNPFWHQIQFLVIVAHLRRFNQIHQWDVPQVLPIGGFFMSATHLYHSDKKLGRGGGLRKLRILGRLRSGSSGRLLRCAFSLYSLNSLNSLNSLSPPTSSAVPYSLNSLSPITSLAAPYSLNSLSPPTSLAAPYSLNSLHSLNIYPLLSSFCTTHPKKVGLLLRNLRIVLYLCSWL